MMRFLYSLLCVGLLFAALGTQKAYAGAWTQPEGKGLFIQQATYYSTANYYDADGKETNQSRFSKYELQPYVEYGLFDNVTIGGTVSLQRVTQSENENWGAAEPEIFVRHTVWQDSVQRVTLQPLIKFRSRFSNEAPPRGGSSSTDVEFSALYGRNLNWVSDRDYLDVRAGYRFRANRLNDQWRGDVALGLGVSPKWQVIPALRVIQSTDLKTAAFSENGDQDFNLTRAELGATYTLSETRSVNVTAFSHVAGKQTGNGEGLTLSLSQAF